MKWSKEARTLTAAIALAFAPGALWAQQAGTTGGDNTTNLFANPAQPYNSTLITTTTTGGVTTTVDNNPGVNPAGTAGLTLPGGAVTVAPTVVNTLNPAVPGTYTQTVTGGTSIILNNGSSSTTASGGSGGPSGNGTTATGSVNASMIAGSGLANTAHDFVNNPDGLSAANTSAIGLCTFCHTPHKAKSTLLLWNHTLSNAVFKWDVAATTAGTALPGFKGNGYTGPSAKCLSCHDGSVAIGDVGWFNESSHNGAGTFAAGGSLNPKFITDLLAGGGSKQVGAGGNLSGTHPVAVPYPLNGAPNTYNGSKTGNMLATNDWIPNPTVNNIRLYSDVGGGAIVGNVNPGSTGIECSSCHDPHNKASKDDFFLRGRLIGSSTADGYICLQCHQK